MIAGIGFGSGMEIGERMQSSAAINAVKVIFCTFVFIDRVLSFDVVGCG